MSAPPSPPEEPAATLTPPQGPPERRGFAWLFFDARGKVRPGLRAVLFLGPAWLLANVLESAVFRLAGPRASFVTTLTISRGLIAAVLLFLSWMYLTVLDQRGTRTLGLWFYPGWSREVWKGAAIGAALIALTVAALVAGRGIVYNGASASALGAIFFLLRLCALFLAGAAMEEVLFRGYGFQRLVESLGRVGGVALMAVLFGAVHLGNGSATALSAINTALAGVLLSVAYLRTRALWLPIGLHWAWNFAQGGVFSLPVSGIEFAKPLLRAAPVGPAWFSGGSYGPEGGVAVTLAGVAGILWLARTRWVSSSPAMREVLE